ncbi:uncharacterized protein LOC132602659 [Lycium barbarum]|uniref:uncharacterized protein LOC132602659 n=1 Tax=Lycium barbarum TaxID=112863 RepID=UPI00293E707B|nr:uncharacterized protein LOC132602659 [Lycium barbarum]
MANKFLFCVLLITLTVNFFWSSNTQVMALRDLPLSEEVQVIEQVVQLRGGKRCFSTCYSLMQNALSRVLYAGRRDLIMTLKGNALSQGDPFIQSHIIKCLLYVFYFLPASSELCVVYKRTSW